jgi:hypothetical protein
MINNQVTLKRELCINILLPLLDFETNVLMCEIMHDGALHESTTNAARLTEMNCDVCVLLIANSLPQFQRVPALYQAYRVP